MTEKNEHGKKTEPEKKTTIQYVETSSEELEREQQSRPKGCVRKNARKTRSSQAKEHTDEGNMKKTK